MCLYVYEKRGEEERYMEGERGGGGGRPCITEKKGGREHLPQEKKEVLRTSGSAADLPVNLRGAVVSLRTCRLPWIVNVGFQHSRRTGTLSKSVLSSTFITIASTKTAFSLRQKKNNSKNNGKPWTNANQLTHDLTSPGSGD